MLGSGGTDLASKYQILAYFEKVLKKLEETGQLQFYAQCRYDGDGRFTSVLDPELEYVVDVRRKVVDASYLTTKVLMTTMLYISYLMTKVPSTHPPKYTIHPGVTLVPINGLARVNKSWEKYVVIGWKPIHKNAKRKIHVFLQEQGRQGLMQCSASLTLALIR